MSLDLPTENWSLHFNSHAYVERDSIIRHNTIIHNLISTHTQTNWSKRANSVRPYEKIIIAAGDTLIPHSSLFKEVRISSSFPPNFRRQPNAHTKAFLTAQKAFLPFCPQQE